MKSFKNLISNFDKFEKWWRIDLIDTIWAVFGISDTHTPRGYGNGYL